MIKKISFTLFFMMPFSVFALTKEFAQEKCLAGINSINIPKEHKLYNALNDGKRYLISFLDSIENSKNEEIPDFLYKCMSGVDAINWFLNEFSETMNEDDAVTVTEVKKDKQIEKAGS